jgi:stage II sporulation protein R
MVKGLFKLAVFALAVLLVFSVATTLKDGSTLEDSLIRFHVKANSDSEADQSLKMQVKDAVVEKLSAALENVVDVKQAENWLRENLDTIKGWAKSALEHLGSDQKVSVSLEEEAFPTRKYDTFSLPAGIYQALRITLGEGEGQNWWCVVFPSLCQSATTADLQEAAQAAGFSERVTDTVTENGTVYEVRFWLLDFFGKIKNALHES